MTSHQNHRTAGIARINGRLASSVLSMLAMVTLVAGIASATQSHAFAIRTTPVPTVTDDCAHPAASNGRSAHRLCRSPIRFFGTAAGR